MKYQMIYTRIEIRRINLQQTHKIEGKIIHSIRETIILLLLAICHIRYNF